jgi:putative transposase
MIKSGTEKLSVERRCELIGFARSTYYYKSRSREGRDAEVMRFLDSEYTKHPFYGVRRMVETLRRNGRAVGRKRVRRIMRLMGLEAIYPRKRLSKADAGHKKYPYLLRGMEIKRPDHVWCADITYIRMKKGFAYLVAILDWSSRYVISWELSNTMDAGFCVETLERALALGIPEIFNTDQGSQFTSEAFTSCLLGVDVRISMDGRGRVYDNIFVERFWRTMKYEEVYVKEYESLVEARESIGNYIEFYNNTRPHQSLSYRTPAEAYGLMENDCAPAVCGGASATSFLGAHSRRAAGPADCAISVLIKGANAIEETGIESESATGDFNESEGEKTNTFAAFASGRDFVGNSTLEML